MSRHSVKRRHRHMGGVGAMILGGAVGCTGTDRLSISFPELVSGESGYLVTMVEQILTVHSREADPDRMTFSSDDPEGTIQVATLPKSPLELGLERVVTPGQAATDSTVQEVGLRLMSAQFSDGAIESWAAGAEELAKFIVPIPRVNCSAFSPDHQVEEIPFNEGIPTFQRLPDETLLAGTDAQLFHFFKDRPYETLDRLETPLSGATKSGWVGGPDRLFRMTVAGTRVELEASNRTWGALSSFPMECLAENARGDVYGVTYDGKVLRMGPSDTILLYDFAANPVGWCSFVERQDGTVSVGVRSNKVILTISGDDVVVDGEGMGSGVAALTEHAGLGLVVADGFGQPWWRPGLQWEKLGQSPIALSIGAMGSYDGILLLGSDHGGFTEYAEDVYCGPRQIIGSNVHFIVTTSDGVFIGGRSSTRESLDVAFLRPRGL